MKSIRYRRGRENERDLAVYTRLIRAAAFRVIQL